MTTKRIRSSNFGRDEQYILLEEIRRHKHILENKTNDKASCREKSEAWRSIENSFNAKSSTQRTVQQLQSKYENFKTDAKRMLKQKGGSGGPYNEILRNPILEMVLEIICPKAIGGHQPAIDSDSSTEIIRNSAKSPEPESEAIVDFIKQETCDTQNTLEDYIKQEPCDIQNAFELFPEESSGQVLVPENNEISTNEIQSNDVEVNEDANKDNPSTSLKAPTDNQNRQQNDVDWSVYSVRNVRRPINKRPKITKPPITAKEIYYEKKSLLLEQEMAYMAAREARAEEEHRKKMELMDLKIQLKQKKLDSKNQ